MFRNKRIPVGFLAVVLVLIGLFVFTSPVQAYSVRPDEIPPTSEPQPAATAEPEESAGEQPAQEAPAVEAPAPTEAPAEQTSDEANPQPTATDPTEPAPQTTDTAPTPEPAAEASEPTQSEADPAPVDPPEIVVVDPNGNAVPLASQQAAEALVAPDPYFYVGTVKYSFLSDCTGVTGICTVSSTPIQAAFDYIRDNGLSPVGGAVYVEEGTYTENVAIDGLEIDSTSGTFKWKVIPTTLALIGVKIAVPGVVPEKTVASAEDVILNGSLTVSNMKSFTLQAFTIQSTVDDNPLVDFESNLGTINVTDVNITNSGTGQGLMIWGHNGPINLTRVDSSGNGDDGAALNNTAGAAAPISVKYSSFDRNGGEGLYIATNGAVTVAGISASYNETEDGAFIYSKGLTVSQSVFSNNTGHGLWVDPYPTGGNVSIQTSQFNDNTLSGAFILQYGNVDFKASRASDNGESGASIDTCNYDAGISPTCQNPYTGLVTISQSNFTGNGTSVADSSGIVVDAKGSITLTDSYAGRNGDSSHIAYGANLNNSHAAAPAPITVNTTNFELNTGHGLLALSKGVITVKDFSSTDNTYNGAYLDNQFAGFTAGVTIANSAGLVNRVTHNGGEGLLIYSNGAVTVSAVEANLNGQSGIHVENDTGTGAVTIDGVAGATANDNNIDGITVLSKGLITVRNMSASGNDGYGYYLNNQAGTGGVTVSTTLARWRHILDGNGLDGLHVLSKGAVSLQKITATNNQHFGGFIDNSAGTSDVTLTDGIFNGNALVNVAPAPAEAGLQILSKGNITLATITANLNGVNAAADDDDVPGLGAYLDNGSALTAKNVTITKGYFNTNFGEGLTIQSTGSVSYNTGSVNNSHTTGIVINNTYAATALPVTLTSITVTNNGSTGVTIDSKGLISLLTSDVNHNLAAGADLDNHLGTGGITITGAAALVRDYSWNSGAGLTINTNGPVSVSYISLHDSGTYGAEVDNTGATSAVTFSNVKVYNNGTYGLDVSAKGAITIDNSFFTSNLGGYGLKLDNSTGAGAVTIKSALGQAISNNSTYGLSVLSKGNITITNIEIHDNGNYGATLDNCILNVDSGLCTGVGAVTINNTLLQDWQNNEGDGLVIDSAGAVTINLINASSSNGDNLDIDNRYGAGTAVPAVTVTNSRFNDSRDGSGITINSKGNVTLTNVEASRSTNGHGLSINNGGLSGKGSVTLSGTSADVRSAFSENSDYGVQIYTNGAVTVKYILAEDNPNYGLSIDNSGAASPLAVTLTSVATNRNASGFSGYGLRVYSKGNITVSDLASSDNGNWGSSPISADGVILDNCRLNLSLCVGTGTVSLTGVDANHNYGDGISVSSFGAITLSDVNASNNHSNGGTYANNASRANPTSSLPDIASVGGVTITLPSGASTATNAYNDNGGYGLQITSNGAVALTGVNVLGNDNANTAASVNNSTAATPLAVSISKSRFSGNSADTGIAVLSKGAITFSTNEVNTNTGSLTAGQAAIELDNHTATAAQNVTVTATTVNGNLGGAGLSIATKGSITLTGITSIGNSAQGVTINASSGIGSVTVNGTRNTVIGNTGAGLTLIANGNVSILNLTSELNTGLGMSVDTSGATGLLGTLTVTTSNFNRNGNSGIFASTNGAITMTGVNSLNNGTSTNGHGADLTTNARDITITNSAFIGNRGSGIRSDTGPANTLRLNATSYLGNDSDRSGDRNLTYTGLITIS